MRRYRPTQADIEARARGFESAADEYWLTYPVRRREYMVSHDALYALPALALIASVILTFVLGALWYWGSLVEGRLWYAATPYVLAVVLGAWLVTFFTFRLRKI